MTDNVSDGATERPTWHVSPTIKPCKHCDKPFTVNRGAGTFCSRRCYLLWRRAVQRPVEQRKCVQCGSQFAAFVSSQRVHCTLPCAKKTASAKRAGTMARPLRSYRSESARIVGTAIAAARVSKQLTQPQVAEMAGLSVATVHAIESGKKGDSPPTMRSLESVLAVLGLRLEVVDASGAKL